MNAPINTIRNISIKFALAFALVATPMIGLGLVNVDSNTAVLAASNAPDEIDAG